MLVVKFVRYRSESRTHGRKHARMHALRAADPNSTDSVTGACPRFDRYPLFEGEGAVILEQLMWFRGNTLSRIDRERDNRTGWHRFMRRLTLMSARAGDCALLFTNSVLYFWLLCFPLALQFEASSANTRQTDAYSLRVFILIKLLARSHYTHIVAPIIEPYFNILLCFDYTIIAYSTHEINIVFFKMWLSVTTVSNVQIGKDWEHSFIYI